MVRGLSHYPVNPAYGSGTFRRRVVLSRAGDGLSASLLDDFHEMTLSLRVAGGVIGDIKATMVRYPRTTCHGAADAFTKLTGLPLSVHASRLQGVDRGAQCTHLLDMVALALVWLKEDGDRFVIELALTDRDAELKQDLQITVNGAVAMNWALCDEAIVQPAQYAGRQFFGGYGRWVNETFPPHEASLWMLAQIGLFVAQGRAFIVDGPIPRASGLEPSRRGACFSYSDPCFDIARDNVGYVRDHSGGLPPPVGAAGKAAQGILK